MRRPKPFAAPLLYGLKSMLIKELLHIKRDPTTLFFALLIPAIQLALFGYAVDFDVRHIRTAVVDMDRSRESRAYLQRVQNTQYIDNISYLHTPREAEDALKRNDVRAAVIIPEDFSRRYGTSRMPQVHVLLDGSDGQVANPARSAFMQQSGPPTGPDAVDVRLNVLFNPDIRTKIYTIPGLVGVILQLVTVSLTGFSLVREREQGTLEQLMVSPVGRLGLMLGKLLPYALLGFAEMSSVIFIARLLFNIKIVGSLPLLMLMSMPFIGASLAIGLLISTVAKTQGQAMQMTLLTTLPSILLSGYITPRETLPLPLYWIGNIFPVTSYIQIIRGIMVRGAGIQELFPSLVSLLTLMVVLLFLATRSFRKSIA